MIIADVTFCIVIILILKGKRKVRREHILASCIPY
jgi:hypothetical protein